MIRGNCRTNLNGFEHEVWPTEFNDNIAIGHRVQAESGVYLYVVGITHRMSRDRDGRSYSPTIEVELHKRL